MKLILSFLLLFISCKNEHLAKDYKVIKIDSNNEGFYWIYLEEIFNESKVYRLTSMVNDSVENNKSQIAEGDIINLKLESNKVKDEFKDSKIPLNNKESLFNKDVFEGKKVILDFYSPCIEGL